MKVGNGIELEAVSLQFELYRWRPCGVTWDSSRTVVVVKLRRTSALKRSPSGLPPPGTLHRKVDAFALTVQVCVESPMGQIRDGIRVSSDGDPTHSGRLLAIIAREKKEVQMQNLD